ncbi:hypothetical protein CHS0354_014504 [Potamilus streckersoni]|uniref:Uncharacterized protein n=1 Tax=Potamilus streckersoni TaxID=2493646 RepID=A0AAE0VS33_9BIVA|nr:hypothetical protein CHS0354_014504 [Potamilus streckersoni]
MRTLFISRTRKNTQKVICMNEPDKSDDIMMENPEYGQPFHFDTKYADYIKAETVYAVVNKTDKSRNKANEVAADILRIQVENNEEYGVFNCQNTPTIQYGGKSRGESDNSAA